MEKEFVPYELAVKLKELGFDEPCFGIWKDEQLISVGGHWGVGISHSMFGFEHDSFLLNEYRAPTFSQAFRWFREKYNIFPEILTDCTAEPKFCYTYTRFFGNPSDLSSAEWGWENNIGQYSLLNRTYEEAELACLEKLIEIVENK